MYRRQMCSFSFVFRYTRRLPVQTVFCCPIVARSNTFAIVCVCAESSLQQTQDPATLFTFTLASLRRGGFGRCPEHGRLEHPPLEEHRTVLRTAEWSETTTPTFCGQQYVSLRCRHFVSQDFFRTTGWRTGPGESNEASRLARTIFGTSGKGTPSCNYRGLHGVIRRCSGLYWAFNNDVRVRRDDGDGVFCAFPWAVL